VHPAVDREGVRVGPEANVRVAIGALPGTAVVARDELVPEDPTGEEYGGAKAWIERVARERLGERLAMPDGRAGVAVDLDEEGSLVVRTDDGGLARVSSGEIANAAAP